MNKKIYISGAITGTDDYMERFGEAQKLLEAKGYDVINPARINDLLPKNTTYEQYMSISITLLDMCSSIYMLKGWEKSIGANREYGYALGRCKDVLCDAICAPTWRNLDGTID